MMEKLLRVVEKNKYLHTALQEEEEEEEGWNIVAVVGRVEGEHYILEMAGVDVDVESDIAEELRVVVIVGVLADIVGTEKREIEKVIVMSYTNHMVPDAQELKEGVFDYAVIHRAGLIQPKRNSDRNFWIVAMGEV